MPNISSLRKDILEDSHRSKFTIHPGSSKMYADIKATLLLGGNEI